MDIIANNLNVIMNAKRAGKAECVVRTTKLFSALLKLAKKEGYIDYKLENGNARISLLKLNACKAIKPRFTVTKEEIEKYVRRFLPARDFGILIVSTSAGLMSHREALEKGIGGVLIAYCF
jgi:small subunit ribosomal protein S8